MQKEINIGIDLMGCETQPIEIAKEVIDLIEELPISYHLIFFCASDSLKGMSSHPRVKIQNTSETISMFDDPLVAVRTKKQSSLCVAMQMLKNQQIDALISACNTGAIIASATFVLSKIPQVKRVALLAFLPTMKRPVAIVDVGAHPEATAQHLTQYATIGIAYQKIQGIQAPKVALLNIGSEKGKGTVEIRKAYDKCLHQFPSMFIGNIEGRDVFNGGVDVVVTDGFSGNVLLKTAEGSVSFILHEIKKDPNLRSHLATLQEKLDYAKYPGALLTGVEGIVMKCHGEGSPKAFRETIKSTIQLLSHDFSTQIQKELSPELQPY